MYICTSVRVNLTFGPRKLDLAIALERDLRIATSMRLHFSTQKNQQRGDILAHACSRHPFCCPVLATIRMIIQHRRFFQRTNTPYDDTTRFASYYRRNTRINLRPEDLTAQLRFVARQCFHSTGIVPKDITARSFQAGGAMALLSAESIRVISNSSADGTQTACFGTFNKKPNRSCKTLQRQCSTTAITHSYLLRLCHCSNPPALLPSVAALPPFVPDGHLLGR